MRGNPPLNFLKVRSFWLCAFLAVHFSERTCSREKYFLCLSTSYYTIVILEQLIPFIKGSDVFHEIMRITAALKSNVHDQN